MSQQAVWNPSQSYIDSTRLYQWMKSLGFSDYDTFHEKSIDDLEWFWDKAVEELGIEWFQDYDQTLDLSKGVKYPNWFVNGKMNVTHNAVDKWAKRKDTANKTALIWESDDGETRTFTYKELQDEVNQTAAGFQQIGIQQGDIITIYMPMLPETLFAMLAASKIGAIFSPAFSGYKADAVATRINAAESKYLITADGFHRKGKTIPMKEEADKAAYKSSSIEKVIVVKRTGRDIAWNNERDVDWDHIRKPINELKTLETNADDPFMIIYTSGTTGKPKGTLHTHAGFPIKSAFDAGVMMDVKQEDTLFWYTDMGWMMGPFLVYGGLVNGSSIVMFEGTPDYPNPDRLWQLVEQHQVTHLGIAPTLVRTLMKHGSSWVDQHDISSLKAFGSSGEPWNHEPWMWLFEDVGNSQIPIINYSGGTEISGGIFTNVLTKPISPVTFNAAIPGMDVHVYDKQATSVKNEVGELVITKPWVGMTNGFYKENERYENTYWNRWPDTWVHGDWVIHDDEGYYTITGRSDDTLNVAGKRTGPAEIESVLVDHDAVVEAGVIGIPHDVKGETPVGFVVLKPNYTASDELQSSILKHAVDVLGKALALKHLHFVEDLPKTRNAKVMRRVIRSAYLNEHAGDLSALENPETVDKIRELGKQEQHN